MAVKTFSANSEPLYGLMKKISDCSIQLPDFQRGWVWDDERIRKLLVSIAKSFPIGAIMFLETGNGNASFYPRPIEGVQCTGTITPSILLLDGQQRLTSLYQTLMLKDAVRTKDVKGNPTSRFYYLRFSNICDSDVDFDENIISVSEDKKRRGPGINNVIDDFSSVELEYQYEAFPINLFYDDSKANDWLYKYEDTGEPENLNNRRQKTRKLRDIINDFKNYQVPTITLDKSNSKEAVCSVFENVNTGGVSLTVFELLTATFAANNFRLRQNWDAREILLKEPYDIGHAKLLEKAEELKISPSLISLASSYATSNFHEILADISSVEFMQALCLLATHANGKAVSCKRKDILLLTVEDYIHWADRLTEGFFDAAKFLQEMYVFSTKDIPYGSQLVPLAAIMTKLKGQMSSIPNKRKLAQWYWCGALGELYGGANETRYARDYVEVVPWITDPQAAVPSTVFDANFARERLTTLRTRNSAAYKAISVLLMKNGARDFESGLPIDMHNYHGISIDIHHIFPKAYCEKASIDMRMADTIINKAPLSYRTNRSIGGRRPSDYIRTFIGKMDEATVNQMLASQCIDTDAIKADDFMQFFDARQEALISLIEEAMEKKAS